MAKPEIFTQPIPKATVKRLADEGFGDMIKFVVDLEKKIVCAGGGLHADAEGLLQEKGSHASGLWGANYYPGLPPAQRIVYRSMINMRPIDGNSQMMIQSPELRRKIHEMALYFFEGQAA